MTDAVTDSMRPPVGDPVAVVVVRDGMAPVGADEAVAEAGGAGVLIGSGTRDAELATLRSAWCAEVGAFAPAGYAARLAPALAAAGTIILPSSPDGRDLAPRLAVALDRPLLAGAVQVYEDGADVLRWGGRTVTRVRCDGAFIATLQPGVRGVVAATEPAELVDLAMPEPDERGHDADVVTVLGPDPATIDLAEAPRIMAAGAGLGSAEQVTLLGEVAESLGASLGATRVVTDAGWTGYERQIGTTGVVVDPELYVAFAVSGAPQHVGGVGNPRHVVSINLDGSAPMTTMADLGIVADARAVLAELAKRLEVHDG